ncbi:hypothetical protein NL676_010028 [Syzygium grande]|nr:hypothetical protein NL676_010028 [Syzygium grande]
MNCSSSGPEIRFPFRIREVQGEDCGYKGFEVSCDDRNRTILHLSEAGDFVMDTIDYVHQYFQVKDLDDCLPKRLLEDQFMSTSLPFEAPDYKSFVFANCSYVNSSMIGPESGVARLDCLSLARHMVVLVMDYDLAQPWMLWHQCYPSMISVPWSWQHPTNISESIWLSWVEPECKSCEAAKERCGLKGPKWGSEVQCIGKHGLSKAARIAMASLFALTWFTCILVFIWFVVWVLVRWGPDRIRSNTVPGSAPSNDVNGEAVEVAQRNAIRMMSISSPTIESYPKTQIDDLGQLPRPSDDVCMLGPRSQVIESLHSAQKQLEVVSLILSHR